MLKEQGCIKIGVFGQYFQIDYQVRPDSVEKFKDHAELGLKANDQSNIHKGFDVLAGLCSPFFNFVAW